MTSPARAACSKYGAVLMISFRQGLANRASVIGRAIFYVLILLVFSRLWAAMETAGALQGQGAAELLWYLALTEWIVISVPWTHLEIEKDVRSGDIAYLLPRPLSYLGMRLAEGLGSLLVRLLVLGVSGFAAAWLLAGRLPADPRGLLLALPLGVLAGAVCTAFHAAIGVCSFWLQDASPLYWIWQKMCFVLGGLVLPLSIYPGWLRTAADWSPFSAILNGPGRLAMDFDPGLALGTFLRLLAWGLLVILLLRWLYGRGLAILDVNGG